MLATPRVPASSRLKAYRAAVRRSRWPAASANQRIRTVKPLMTRATISITANVTKYCVSLTANVRKGGTKKKSKAATLRIEAKIEAPGSDREATRTTPSK